MTTQVKTSPGSTHADRQSRYWLLSGFRTFSVSIVFFSLGFGLNAATATTTKSDAELSRTLIGTWEVQADRKFYPFIKSFLSFNPNGTYKWVGIADFLGHHGREERQGKWRVTDGRLIRQEAVGSAPQIDYVPGDQHVSLQGDIVILHSKDGDEEMRRAAILTQLPPLLSPHWTDKLILEKPTPDYPIEARRLRFQGQGLFKLHINQKTGTVEFVGTVISTGHKMLDDAAIRAFKNWRFKPETMRLVGIPIRFTLTRNAHPEKPVDSPERPIDSLIPRQSLPVSPEVVR